MMRTVAALLLLACAAAAQTTYRITGVVVNGMTRQPLARAVVSLGPEGGATIAVLTTGADGRFSFSSLRAAKWQLSASKRGFLSATYAQNPELGSPGSSVFTGPDQFSEDLSFELYPQAVITGKVTGENGEPAHGALVQLFYAQLRWGLRRTSLIETQRTNEAGEYRFWGLHPGSYLIAASGRPWYAAGQMTDDGALSFQPQFFHEATSARSATPIPVKPGEEFEADFPLHTARGVRVIVTGIPANAGAGLASETLPGSWAMREVSMPGDAPVFYGVLPGTYRLVTGNMSGAGMLAQTVEVGTSNLNVAVDSHPLARIRAEFRMEAGNASKLSSMTAVLSIEDGSANMMRRPNASTPVYYESLVPGRYQLRMHGEDRCYLSSVTVDDVAIGRGFFSLPNRGEVRLLATVRGDGGRIYGRVLDGEHPLVGASVILAPQTATGEPSDYGLFQTDGDGSFDFGAVRPGDWYVFATPDTAIEYANPSAIRRYLKNAKALHIEPGATVELTLEAGVR